MSVDTATASLARGARENCSRLIKKKKEKEILQMMKL